MPHDRELSRRAFVATAAAGVLAPALAVRSARQEAAVEHPARMPVTFVSHGAPTLAVDSERGAELRAWAAALPRPRALLVVSAHWEKTPAVIGTTRPTRLLYDFSGFPRELYRLEYRAPGAPELAARVGGLLGKAQRDEQRPWDHGVWVPLLHMYPEADVPLLQVSLPTRATPAELFALGRALAPLRDEGVLVIGSGGMTHNLWEADPSPGARPAAHALAFEAWARGALRDWRVDELLDFGAKAPDLERVHPTLEHLVPLLVAAGAASTDEPQVSFPIQGFELGSLSRTAVQFG